MFFIINCIYLWRNRSQNCTCTSRSRSNHISQNILFPPVCIPTAHTPRPAGHHHQHAVSCFSVCRPKTLQVTFCCCIWQRYSDNEIRIKHDEQQFVTGKSKLVKQGYLTRPSARSFRQTNLHLISSCYPFLIPAATCFCSLKLFSHRWRYIRRDPSHTLRKHLKYAHSHQEP